MRSFLIGWRRKTGCILLMAALALMAGWVRSKYLFDVCNCPMGQNYAVALTSWQESFAIRVGWDKDDPWNDYCWDTRDHDNWGYVNDPESTCYRFKQPIPDGSGCFVTWYLLSDGAGIGVTPLHQRSYCKMVFAIVPYWSVILPLTLLSAYLILWMPQKRVQINA
jgi:hypothetical protein